MSVEAVGIDQGRSNDSKHWFRYALIVLAVLAVGTVIFEYIHWLQSGMGFEAHMGHLRDHIWSFITTGSWHPDAVAAWMWG